MNGTNTLTLTKPTEAGQYWFLPNGLSPKSMDVDVHLKAVQVSVSSGLAVLYWGQWYPVSQAGGLWSEKLEGPGT